MNTQKDNSQALTQLFKQMDTEIVSDFNFSKTYQTLANYFNQYESQVKTLDATFYKIKFFLHMINGQYQDALNLKSKLSVYILA